MTRRIPTRRPRHSAIRQQLAKRRGLSPLARMRTLAGMIAAFRFFDDAFGETDGRRRSGSAQPTWEADDGLPF